MPDQAAIASLLADSTITADTRLAIVAEALLPTSAAMLGFAHVHLGEIATIVADSSLNGLMNQGWAVEEAIGADSSLTGLMNQGWAAQASMDGDSSSSVEIPFNHNALAFIGATSQVMANGYVHVNVSSPITADSALAPNPLGNYKGTVARLTGASASLVAAPSVHWVAQANIEASSTFTTWVILLFSGNLVGAGSVTSTPVVVHLVSGHLDGAGSLTGSVIQTLIFGAQIVGSGTLQDGLLITLLGTLSGAGDISATTQQLVALRPLPLVGSGSLRDSLPLPLTGFGFLTGFVEVIKLPRPYCPPRHDKTFRFGYILTRGDLELRVCDAAGSPFAPVVVLYAFYQIVPGGQRMLVGPPNRRPATDSSQGKVGRYYATGTAGELGQPGNWVVVWRFQRSWWTPTETFEESFKVVDEVTSGDPGALYGRCIKYGWL